MRESFNGTYQWGVLKTNFVCADNLLLKVRTEGFPSSTALPIYAYCHLFFLVLEPPYFKNGMKLIVIPIASLLN